MVLDKQLILKLNKVLGWKLPKSLIVSLKTSFKKAFRIYFKTIHYNLEMTLLSSRMSEYPTITQGKTRIPGINDGEEFEQTDVSWITINDVQVFSSRVHRAQQSLGSLISCTFFSMNIGCKETCFFLHWKCEYSKSSLKTKSKWRRTSMIQDHIWQTQNFLNQQTCVSCRTISTITITYRKVKSLSPVLMTVRKCKRQM